MTRFRVIHVRIYLLGLRKPNIRPLSCLVNMLQASKLTPSKKNWCRSWQICILNDAADGRNAVENANLDDRLSK